MIRLEKMQAMHVRYTIIIVGSHLYSCVFMAENCIHFLQLLFEQAHWACHTAFWKTWENRTGSTPTPGNFSKKVGYWVFQRPLVAWHKTLGGQLMFHCAPALMQTCKTLAAGKFFRYFSFAPMSIWCRSNRERPCRHDLQKWWVLCGR